ncbi:hypothetical protein LCGC14_1028940 [marine sediment metagenome]|uniref:Uncharacterized protein n=1 Tax=marine sediment metagenome TaxID=412755 RepID=A0A0F9MV59_9ZZZZ
MGKDEVKAKKDEWKVSLVVVNEDTPPKKYLIKGDETLDQSGAIAKILNELEKLNEAMLS